MSDPYKYTTLMCSLPDLGQLFHSRRPPLSRLRLEQRLAMLEKEDAALLARIERVMQWDYLSLEQTDEEIVRYVEGLTPEIPDRDLRELVQLRLETRTLMAALRRRRAGLPAPARGEVWGIGIWTDHIRRHWSESGFRLEHAYPWIKEAVTLLERGESLALERLILGTNWRKTNLLSEGHYFDFTAVAFYVLKWDMVARWTGYHGAKAAERFQALTRRGLAGHEAIFV